MQQLKSKEPKDFSCLPYTSHWYTQDTYWEGGVRVPAMIYSPLFDASITGQSNDCLFYIADWFTTILGFAGNTADLGVDGVDQWEAISSMGATCPREQFQ